MADDFADESWKRDYFDPQGNPLDVPGTVRPFGDVHDLSAIQDWASNLKPSDTFRYVHDPEGFKADMVSRGIPPPPVDHEVTPNGTLGVVRTDERGKIMGNLSDYVRGAEANASDVVPQAGKALGYGPEPELKPEERGPNPAVEAIKRNIEKSGQAQPYPPGQDPGRPPITRPQTEGSAAGEAMDPGGGIVEGAKRIWNRGFGTGPKPETPPAAPTAAAPPPLEDKGYVGGGPKVKEAEAEPVVAAIEKEAKSKEKMADAFSDFAKSMRGVQMPKGPQLSPTGTPGAPHPLAIHPTVANLLALAGQRQPAPQAVNLMRLLGRA